MSAILSSCGAYRYRLERVVDNCPGDVVAYFGVNPSTADATEDDHTIRKWRGFTIRAAASSFIVGNLFAYRATDVRELATAADPLGPDNDAHLAAIIAEADVLVPCWGSRAKLPRALRPRLDVLRDMIFAAGKPVRVLGLTASGDPIHPLTLAYTTPLVEWRP